MAQSACHTDARPLGQQLHDAVAESEPGVVRQLQLLRAGARVDAAVAGSGGAPCTPLFSASINGNDSVVQCLLEAGAAVDARCEDDYLGMSTPLISAAVRGHAGAVQQLLDAGADVEATGSDYGGTALFLAACQGHAGIVQQLLDAGADVYAGHFAAGGCLPLEATVERGHPDVLPVLLRAGAVAEMAACRAALPWGGTPTGARLKQELEEAGAPLQRAVVEALEGAAMDGRPERVLRVLGGFELREQDLVEAAHLAFRCDNDDAIMLLVERLDAMGPSGQAAHGVVRRLWGSRCLPLLYAWRDARDASGSGPPPGGSARRELEEARRGVQELVQGLAAMHREQRPACTREAAVQTEDAAVVQTDRQLQGRADPQEPLLQLLPTGGDTAPSKCVMAVAAALVYVCVLLGKWR